MNYFKPAPRPVNPHIEYLGCGGQWNEVYGHGCRTSEEAEAYCKRFGDAFRARPVIQPAEPVPLIQGEL